MGENAPDAASPAARTESKKTAGSQSFGIMMDRINDYEFRVRFDKQEYGQLMMDEPPPLGGDRGPNASRILAAAVGNCLSASLLFCASKARVETRGVHTEVKVEYSRNPEGRLRIGKINVEISPELDASDLVKARRCLDLFEDYCVVTQSVRKGIDVSVAVRLPSEGAE